MTRVVAAVPLLLALGCGFATAQQTTPPPPGRAEILAAARAVMKQAHFTALITVGQDGQPQARILDPCDPEPDLTVWLGTNPLTRKVAQIRENPRATLFYFDQGSASYVTLLGTAQLITEEAERVGHWQARWAPYWPDGPRGDDFVLIRFRPHTLEIVSGPHKLLNDPLTWRPVTLALE